LGVGVVVRARVRLGGDAGVVADEAATKRCFLLPVAETTTTSSSGDDDDDDGE